MEKIKHKKYTIVNYKGHDYRFKFKDYGWSYAVPVIERKVEKTFLFLKLKLWVSFKVNDTYTILRQKFYDVEQVQEVFRVFIDDDGNARIIDTDKNKNSKHAKKITL